MYRLERGGGGPKDFFLGGGDGGGMDHMVLGGGNEGGVSRRRKGGLGLEGNGRE